MKRMTRRSIVALAAVAATLGLFAPPASADAAYSSIPVPANNPSGYATGITIQSGQLMTFNEAGSTANYGYEGSTGCTGYPLTHFTGVRYVNNTICNPAVKDDPNALVSGGPIGGLIARIGSGPWFAAWTQQTIQATTSGQLVLGYNDSIYTDNQGQYWISLIVSTPSGTTTGGDGGTGGGGTCTTRCQL